MSHRYTLISFSILLIVVAFASGNVRTAQAATETSADTFVLKYDFDGNIVSNWDPMTNPQLIYDSGGSDGSYGVAYSSGNNTVYVTTGAQVVKYNTDGTRQDPGSVLSIPVSGVSSSPHTIKAVPNSSGDIIVVNNDINNSIISRYNSSGGTVWTQTLTILCSTKIPSMYSVAISNDGSFAYPAGYDYYPSQCSRRYSRTLKYNAASGGASLWGTDGDGRGVYYPTSGNVIAKAWGVAVNPAGTYVYIVVDDGSNFKLYKLNASNGVSVWSKTVSTYSLWLGDVVVGSESGNDVIYVAGVTRSGTYNYEDFYIVKFSDAGSVLWSTNAGMDSLTKEFAESIILDPSGTAVYVTGVYQPGMRSYLLTVKYNASDGGLAWSPRIHNMGKNEYNGGLAVDSGGVYVSGYFYDPKPDLYVANLANTPATVYAGDWVTFSGDVKNYGGTMTQTTQTRLRIDFGNNGTWDWTATNQSTGPITYGVPETETWPNEWQATGTTAKFEICADATGLVTELEETNNCPTQTFTINAVTLPTVTSVTGQNPQTSAGGKSITIIGTNFVATPTVTIGGTSATNVTFVSATQLTATAPAKSAGLYNVVVTNPDTQFGTCTNCLEYIDPPSGVAIEDAYTAGILKHYVPANTDDLVGQRTVTGTALNTDSGFCTVRKLVAGAGVDPCLGTTLVSANFKFPNSGAGSSVALRVYGRKGNDSNGISVDFPNALEYIAKPNSLTIQGQGNPDSMEYVSALTSNVQRVINGNNLPSPLTSSSITQTDDTATNTGFNLTGKSFSSTTVTGSGNAASVVLTTTGSTPPSPSVTVGMDNTCASTTGGSVFCWGRNIYGQLGDNTTTDRLTPVQVKGVGGSGYLTSVSQVTSGWYHNCALRTDGTVYCWGRNDKGQLGINISDANPHLTPAQVFDVGGTEYLTGVSQIDAGWNHTCALKTDGQVYCWGSNSNGQLGNNSSDFNPHPTPLQVINSDSTPFIGVSQITAGDHTCASKTDGTAYCWGPNSSGQLGDNTTVGKLTPVQVLGVGGSGSLTGVSQITAGESHTCASKTDGTAFCWGDNYRGKLGDNTTVGKITPVQVLGVGGSGYLTSVSRIDAGEQTCALKTDGTAFCWGYGAYGQLGDNTTTSRYTPVQVVGVGGSGYLTSVSQIAPVSGSYHTCALKTDGTAYCWGANNYGKLGDNTTTQRNAPVQVLGVGGSGYLDVGVVPIATATVVAGGNYNCALKNDGTVFCWGVNTTGQLGDNTLANKYTPVQVLGVGGSGNLTGVSQIAAGWYHTCAIKTDSTVFCWGSNTNGQLGDNTTAIKKTPVQVLGVGGSGNLTGVSQITAGQYHTCALKTDGTVFCWGSNTDGQLGDNTTNQNITPVQVLGVGGSGYLTGVSQIDAGNYHTCVLKTDGTAFCWGRNADGQLGDNTIVGKLAPVQVLGVGGSGYLTGISQITAGNYHTCVLKTDGTAFCWGNNLDGQIGDNTGITDRLTPVQVLGVGGSGYLIGVSQIDAGGMHTCALKTDSTAFCWGFNWYGQLGDNTQTDRHTPVQVLGVGGSGYLIGVARVTSGWYHTCAIKTDGTAFCWGDNPYGQLGDNTTVDKLTPVQVLGVGGSGNLNVGTTAPSAPTVASVSSGGYTHTCASKTDGTAYCWGDNATGQLGDNTQTDRLTPVQVLGVGGSGYLTGVSQITAGMSHSCVLKTDGTVFCWGSNSFGALGDNTTTSKLTPVQVLGVGGSGYLTDVSEISAGNYNTCALKTDGTVFCWGYNSAGQLGDNSQTNRLTPVQVLGVGGSGYLTDVSQIDGGGPHTCAVKTDGTAYCWGRNTDGELGDNTQTMRLTPVQVLGVGGSGYLTSVLGISAGMYHTCAVKTDNTAYCWGYNVSGRIGDNTQTMRLTPVQVLGVGGSGYLTSVLQIDATDSKTCAIKTDGTTYCWGSNTYGQLGDNTQTMRLTPVQVLGVGGSGNLTGVSQIGGGGFHACAIKTDGTIYCWGRNADGQLGINSTTDSFTSLQVLGVGGSGYLNLGSPSGYSSPGTFTSGPIDIGAVTTAWGNLSWTQTGTGTITIKARSDADGDFSNASDWTNCGNISSGNSLTSGSPNCVSVGHRYIQYQATLGTTDTSVTPSLDDVTIGYSTGVASIDPCTVKVGSDCSLNVETGPGANQITVTLPSLAAGSYNLTVFGQNGTTANGISETVPGGIIYENKPSISSIQTSVYVATAGNQSRFIYGANLTYGSNESKVTLDDVPVASNDNAPVIFQIPAYEPERAVGPATVRVYSEHGTSANEIFDNGTIYFENIPFVTPPLEPQCYLDVNGGQTVTVNGGNLFGGTGRAKIDPPSGAAIDTNPPTTSGMTTNTINFVSPAHAVGPAILRLYSENGNDGNGLHIYDTIYYGNSPPTAVIEWLDGSDVKPWPSRGLRFKRTYVLTGQNSTDVEPPVCVRGITTYSWTMERYPAAYSGLTSKTSTNSEDKTFNFTPDALGSYRIKLTVTDAGGATHTTWVPSETTISRTLPVWREIRSN